jgi:integrase
MNKSDIIALINNSGKSAFEESNAKMKEENQMLKRKLQMNEMISEKAFKYLKQVSDESKSLMISIEGVDPTNPLQKIEKMILSESTKQEYVFEWKLYSKFCENKQLNCFLISSADEYLQSIKCQISTLIKKRGNLQSILTFLLGRRIKLMRIGKKHKPVPKYALNYDEVEAYLKEQEEVDREDFLIQFLLIQYGLRVNSAALIKVNHLDFLEVGSTIVLPDSKTGPRFERITPRLHDLLKKYVEEKRLKQDDYLFSVQGRCPDEKTRAHSICVRINQRIKNSKVLKGSKNYKLSSHMFRKTKAFTAFQDAVNEAKEKARLAIGHQKGSSAIESYIYL